MIRKFLAREVEFLVAELGAFDARTLLWRAFFWLYVTIFITAALLGLVAVYNIFGLPLMYAVVFILFLLCLRLEPRTPSHFEGEPLVLGGDRPPSPPPPAQPASPAPGTPRLGRSSMAVTTKHRPALPKSSPK
jgi:hypothetical protein